MLYCNTAHRSVLSTVHAIELRLLSRCEHKNLIVCNSILGTISAAMEPYS